MDARLSDFAALLRHNGLRVGPGELADAARATALVGLEDRESFRAALRACLVKRGRDIDTFERVFALYFRGVWRALDAVDASLFEAIRQAGLLQGDELTMVLATLRRLIGEMSPLARAAAEGDRAQLARLLRGAVLQIDFSKLENPLQEGFFSRRLLSAAGAPQAERELESLAQELQQRGVSADGLELVSRRVGEAMRQLERAAREIVKAEADARLRKGGSDALADRPFAQLSGDELERTASAVRRLAERLKTRLIRRQRTRRRGALHVRRTLRRNLSWGGVPARLAFRTRRPERPDVVVLCDVSDSVRGVSKMMLLFVHTLQSLFHRVRSFVFVSDVGEVTECFRDVQAREAVDLATAGRTINLHANSNYGRALATFARDHLGAVSRRTTVLVIGDGRTNFSDPQLWALREIRRKAKRVIWICPEPPRAWGFGDSEMPRYAKLCHRVATVQNLADLAEVADQLVPR